MTVHTPMRVGIDIVSVAEVADSLSRFGDRYIRRLFTNREATYCRSACAPVAAARFAARLAAKEATVKALQPEHVWSDWRLIEVRRHRSGRCALRLHGEAAELAARSAIHLITLSMSHEGDHAAAVVIALGEFRLHRRKP